VALIVKVIIYLDGEHNTVEVKDKIRSVLPDARYMIFHPAENMGKVTEFDRIKNMSVEEMAGFVDNVMSNTMCEIPKCTKFDGCCIECIRQWLETEVEE
jgi:hypothetical protein